MGFEFEGWFWSWWLSCLKECSEVYVNGGGQVLCTRRSDLCGQANDSNAFNFTFMSKVSSRKPKRQWAELCKVWLARGSKVTYKAVKQ
jgi:hypothetical protein